MFPSKNFCSHSAQTATSPARENQPRRAIHLRGGHEEVAATTMASLRSVFIQLRGRYQAPTPQWQQLRQMLQGLQISPKARHTRPLSTTPPRPDDVVSKDDGARPPLDQEGLEAYIAKHSGEDTRPAGDTRPAKVAQPGAWTGRGMLAGRLFGEMKDREESSPRPRSDQNLPRPRGSAEPVEDEFDELGEGDNSQSKIHARALPVSPSYFSRQTEFNDSYLTLQKLMRKYAHLPIVPPSQVERVAFRTLKDFRLSHGEDVKASQYARCMTLVKRMHKIHPDLQPPSVKMAIAPFKRDINPHNHKGKEIHIDKFGRTLGVGKRKTSTARAWVVEGTGEVLVNGKSLADAFGRVHDRESVVWALKSTARTDKYNVWALVDGGGTTGQAEALAMAVGKALMGHEPALKPALRRGECSFLLASCTDPVLTFALAGVVTRDPRGVERKKHGHLKARKKPAWVKR